jgi:hypothetical protein
VGLSVSVLWLAVSMGCGVTAIAGSSRLQSAGQLGIGGFGFCGFGSRMGSSLAAGRGGVMAKGWGRTLGHVE